MIHSPAERRQRLLIAEVINACDTMAWRHERLVGYRKALIHRAHYGSYWHPEQDAAIQLRALSRLMFRGIRSIDEAYRLFDGPDADAVWNGVAA